jgi:hypothetical protein
MNSKMRLPAVAVLITGFSLVVPDHASAAEPGWWTAQKKSCRLSPGLAYNSWDGRCNSGASSGAPTGGGYTPQQQMILNSAQQMMPLLQQAVHDAVYGNPQEEARRAQEAERIRILQQQADEEALRQQELAKQRILGLLKGADEQKPLEIKRDEAGPPAGSGLALLKLGESASPTDAAGAQARSGFDTQGQMQGATLPEPPPAPGSGEPDSALVKALQVKLDQGAKDQKFLDELLATLEKSAKADPALVRQIRQKRDLNTRELDAVAKQIAVASAAVTEAKAPPKVGSAGFTKGFEAASQCYSQNAGRACTGLTADQQQACVAGYRAGYEAGDKVRQQVMGEAYKAGTSAGAAGGLDNSASDPRAEGPCRVEWIKTYNRGYFQSKNAAVRQ